MALVRAIALKDFRVTALSTTDNSTGAQLGSLSTGQQLYGALHQTNGSTGRSFVVSIQSATSSAFSPANTRITFSNASSVANGAWGTPIGNYSTNDSWIRASWTLSTTASTGGSWTGMIWAGIR